MAMVEYKGLHTVKAKGRTYYYAWRGGPAVKGEVGTPEFHASYNEAVASRIAPDGKRFRAAIILYKSSDAYKDLAESTKRNWAPWLDRISDHFGELSTSQFDRPDRIRPVIRKWRAKYADKPRTADYGMQVLSRVLAYCVMLGWRYHRWRGALLAHAVASDPASAIVFALAATLARIDQYAAVRALLAVGILVASALVAGSAWHLIRPYLRTESRLRMIVIAAIAVGLVVVGATPVRVLLVAAVVSSALPIKRTPS